MTTATHRFSTRWNPRRIALLGVFFVALMTVLLLLGASNSDVPRATSSLPSLRLPYLRDPTKELDLAELRGTPLVINFFFSDCPPCAKELPLLEQVAQSTEGNVQFVGIDHGESVAKGAAMADRFGLTYTLLNDESGRLAPLVGALAFPTTLFVDREGRIIRRHLGAISPADLNSKLQSIS